MRKAYQYKKHMHVCVGVCTHTYTQNLFCIGHYSWVWGMP